MGTVGELEAVSEWANFNDPTVGFYFKRRNNMKKLETKADIVEWAKVIVEAKGEKFTPMSKGDLYAVATYILEKEQEDLEKVVNAEGDGKDMPTPKAPGTAEEGIVEEGQKDYPDEGCPAHGDPMQECMENSAIISGTYNLLPMTRAEFYRKNKCPVQRVYDEFLKWCAENPSEGNVMDFSTGVYNKGAAFAYWLQDVITVEIKA